MNNGDVSAMPVESHEFASVGMSKREYIAAMALQGILANKVYMATPTDKAAMAVWHADALLEELEKGGGE